MNNNLREIFVLGLCGGSGSGKTTAVKVFASFGAVVLDCDRIYSELVSPSEKKSECLSEIEKAFGKESVLQDGSLNRRYVSSVVFSDSEKRELLNKITHKYIIEEVRNRIREMSAEGRSFFVVDAPVLFESGFDKECSMTLAVTSDKALRIKRIIERDGLTLEQAQRRIDSQTDDAYIARKADFSIDNSGTLEELEEKTASFYKEYIAPKIHNTDGE